MGRKPSDGNSDFAQREAARFVAELGRLKGTYVKIGQMMALFGEHFLPSVLTDALHELGDKTEPLHWDALESAVRVSLGERFDELDIELDAIAAASLAQVHLARVRDSGELICLKIQYPALAEIIDSDFDAVVRMLLLARWVKAGRDLDDWLESMREHLHNEIDYAREAQLTDRMRDLVSGIDIQGVHFSVPRTHTRYSTDMILALDYMEGCSVTDDRVRGLSQQRRNLLAEGMLELFFLELYEWGCLQTDPNFGNYLIKLDDRRKRVGEDELVLLDFGSVLDCDDSFLYHLRHIIDAGMLQDVERLVEHLIGLKCLPGDASEEAQQLFAEFCLQLLEPLRHPKDLPAEYLNQQGEYCWGESRLMRRAGKQAAISASSRHFSTPSRDFALIARKLTGVFTFIDVLRAEFNGHDKVRVYIDRWREREGLGKA